MKTILKILAISLPILLTSCSKDKDECDRTDENSSCYEGPAADNKLLLAELKKNGNTELRFEYDDQNRVIVRYVHATNGDLYMENFNYDLKGRLIGIERKKSGEIYLREEFSYGDGDKPISGVWTTPGVDDPVSVQYGYPGNMVTETLIDGDGEVISANTYTFNENGNLIGTTIGQVVMEYGDYDDKPYYLTNYPWAWKLRSVNNPRSVKLTSIMGSYDQLWKYTYNASGYPIKSEVYNNGSDVLLETNTYDYIPAK